MTASTQSASGCEPASCIGSRRLARASKAGNRLYAWKTNPIRPRLSRVNLAIAQGAEFSAPSQTWPLLGVLRPARQCIKLDLPDPDGPMIAVNAPRAKSTETPERAVADVSPRA